MKLPSKSKITRPAELRQFAADLIKIDDEADIKVSSRGWCYTLEGMNEITKQRFDRVDNLIVECRKNGLLPVDFVAEEEGRTFHSIWNPNISSPEEDITNWIKATLDAGDLYKPDYWEGEKYYIQMLVEKIDLVNLFMPLCEKYHIPIATSKGWSSILQRDEIAQRFKRMEEKGHECVLLYCGDLDVAGLEISNTLMKNFKDLELATKWNPDNMIIDRFGLNLEFVEEFGLTWIDNLETAGGTIAKEVNGEIIQGKTNKGRPHPDFYKPATQEYLSTIGVRKCEANALVQNKVAGKELCQNAILKYLDDGIDQRIDDLKNKTLTEFKEVFERTNILEPLESALNMLKNGE